MKFWLKLKGKPSNTPVRINLKSFSMYSHLQLRVWERKSQSCKLRFFGPPPLLGKNVSAGGVPVKRNRLYFWIQMYGKLTRNIFQFKGICCEFFIVRKSEFGCSDLEFFKYSSLKMKNVKDVLSKKRKNLYHAIPAYFSFKIMFSTLYLWGNVTRLIYFGCQVVVRPWSDLSTMLKFTVVVWKYLSNWTRIFKICDAFERHKRIKIDLVLICHSSILSKWRFSMILNLPMKMMQYIKRRPFLEINSSIIHTKSASCARLRHNELAFLK